MVYIGQHITNDLQDRYLGSGVDLVEDIRKLGKDSFEKEILFIFDNFSEMNNKEREFVDLNFISRSDTYNKQLGGRGWGTEGTCIIFDNVKQKYIRIPKILYNPEYHKTPTTGTVLVYEKSTGDKRRISVEEYSSCKDLFLTASSNKVSIRHKLTNKTQSIGIELFDPNMHEKVFGGIVVEKDGQRQYVAKEEFKQGDLVGVHKNKVTVFDTKTKTKHHITTEEYQNNKDRYIANGKGFVTVYDSVNDKTIRISTDEFVTNKDRYNATTTGQRTVYNKITRQFENILRENFNKDIYKLANDKFILCVDERKQEKFRFWGTKREFIKLYSELLYKVATKGIKINNNHHKYDSYRNCNFFVIDWRKYNGCLETDSTEEILRTINI